MDEMLRCWMIGVLIIVGTVAGDEVSIDIHISSGDAVVAPNLSSTAPPNNTFACSVDRLIESAMRDLMIPGVSLGVIRDGQTLHARGYGYSNMEHRVPVKLDTVFQSGSVGKQFTAMAIMILVERGVLILDNPIRVYFKDTPLQWSNITVRHLLTQTSGLTAYPEDLNFRADYTEDEIYEEFKKMPLASAPGERWAYSNPGYVLLGILIRRVTDQFYGDFLRDNVFAPLGMSTARVISEADIIPNRASGYVFVDGQLRNQEWVSPTLNTMADGALYLTYYDLLKWNAGLGNNQLLKNQSSFDAMWTPGRLNNGTAFPYGFGWMLKRALNGMHIVEHGGVWQGFQAMIIRVLEMKLTVIFLANVRHQNVYQTARRVLELYDAQLAEVSTF